MSDIDRMLYFFLAHIGVTKCRNVLRTEKLILIRDKCSTRGIHGVSLNERLVIESHAAEDKIWRRTAVASIRFVRFGMLALCMDHLVIICFLRTGNGGL